MSLLRPIVEVFSTPSHETLVQRELEDARRELLAAQSAQEYATAMVQYHTDRIARLGLITRESA